MSDTIDLIFTGVFGAMALSGLLSVTAIWWIVQDKRVSQLEALNIRLTDELNKMQHLLDARTRELKEYKTSVDEFQ